MVNKTDIPCTFENWSNPWIIDKQAGNEIEIDNHKVTAAYMWTLTIPERQQLLQDVFNYYRKNGFPYELYDDEYVIKQFNKLKKYNSSNVLTEEGYISNSGNLCLDLCRHFCWDTFWKAEGETVQSIEDVFNNDELFKAVLKNRMGWNTTNEGNEERPYLFGITDKMIRDGIRNSGYGYGVSNFRPTIAKFIYEKYLDLSKPCNVFDYSGGWGARAMAAASLGIDYYSVDPLTANAITKEAKFLHNKCSVNSKIICYESGSEIKETYKMIPQVDMCMSCPPYFNLEVYNDSQTQSYNAHKNFDEWIATYWTDTVDNCLSILKDTGTFVLIIKDYYGKLPLKDAMENILISRGLCLKDSYQYKTTQNHLSGKAKTGIISKNTEYVLVYERR